jgi:hypothetical protein
MSAERFFITGLPRSRTTWLANLFTYGASFCFHDLLGECRTVEDMDRHFEDIARGGCVKHVGNSDSALPWVWRRVREVWPEARWLIIEREPEEALRSYLDYFRVHPYAGFETPSAAEAERAISWLYRELGILAGAIPQNLLVRMTVEALDVLPGVERAWGHLLPKEPCNVDRWVMLDRMRIDPAPEKIKVDQERLGRMMLRNNSNGKGKPSWQSE